MRGHDVQLRRCAAGLLLTLVLAGCGGVSPSGAAQAFIHDHTACPVEQYANPQWSPGRGGASAGPLIYFNVLSLGATGHTDLHVMTALGRDDRLLVEDVLATLVAPDGATVLFQRPSPGTIQSYHFFVYDVASGEYRPLSTAGVRASWSPDSRWFVYAAPTNGAGSGINKIDIRTNQIAQLDRASTWSDWPMWSPDGRMIAFTRAQNLGSTDVIVMNADGSGLATLELGGLVCSSTNGIDEGRQLAAWRPDGQALAVERVCQVGTTISIIGTDGAELTRLNVPGGGAREVSWSPDGAQMVFTSRDNTTTATTVYTARVDGSAMRALAANASSPRWSPDGRQIVFVGQDASGLSEVYTIHPDGSALTQLTNNPGHGVCLH